MLLLFLLEPLSFLLLLSIDHCGSLSGDVAVDDLERVLTATPVHARVALMHLWHVNGETERDDVVVLSGICFDHFLFLLFAKFYFDKFVYQLSL